MRTSVACDRGRFQKGQGLVEYGLVLVLVSVVVIVILSTLGGGVKQTLCRITMTLGGTCGECAESSLGATSPHSSSIALEAGQTVTLRAEAASNRIVNMMVTAPGGALVLNDQDQTNDGLSTATFTASVTGNYSVYVDIASSPGHGAPSPYTLTYSGC